MADHKKPRLFFIDNLRILLIALLLLHHLAITYGASGNWPYHEPPSSDLAVLVLSLFTAINQAFFLGFFFMISGYFTPGSYDRKGAGAFLKDRLLRLGVPLLFYLIVIDPLIEYAVAVKVRGFEGGFRQFLAGYIGEYDGLSVGPLWFVETLLIFTIIYVLWRQVMKPATHLPQRASKPPSNMTIALFALVLGVVTFILRIWLPKGWYFRPLALLVPDYPQYFGLFVFGIVAYRRNWFLEITDKMGKLWLILAVIFMLLFPVLFAAGGALEGNTDPFMGGIYWQAFAFALWENSLCMGMVIGLLVLFRKRLNHQGVLAKAMSAGAYTVYIIHAAVLVFLGLTLRGLKLPSLLKFVLVAPVAVALCFFIAYFIRKLPLVRNIL